MKNQELELALRTIKVQSIYEKAQRKKIEEMVYSLQEKYYELKEEYQMLENHIKHLEHKFIYQSGEVEMDVFEDLVKPQPKEKLELGTKRIATMETVHLAKTFNYKRGMMNSFIITFVEIEGRFLLNVYQDNELQPQIGSIIKFTYSDAVHIREFQIISR